jgi:hypothetical protein
MSNMADIVNDLPLRLAAMRAPTATPHHRPGLQILRCRLSNQRSSR